MATEKLLIISIAIIILAIIVSITYTVNLPKDLQCKRVMAVETSGEMILTDCYNPHTSRGDTTYTVKVKFEK